MCAWLEMKVGDEPVLLKQKFVLFQKALRPSTGMEFGENKTSVHCWSVWDHASSHWQQVHSALHMVAALVKCNRVNFIIINVAFLSSLQTSNWLASVLKVFIFFCLPSECVSSPNEAVRLLVIMHKAKYILKSLKEYGTWIHWFLNNHATHNKNYKGTSVLNK